MYIVLHNRRRNSSLPCVWLNISIYLDKTSMPSRVLSYIREKRDMKRMDNTPFSHRGNLSGQKNGNVVATCVILFTYACLLTAGIS